MNNKSIRLGIYEHYKGGRYEVICVVRHCETMEDLVIYRPLYEDGALWARPLEMFIETVEVNGKKVPRFKLEENKNE